MALTLLSLQPRDFWALTPAETADLILAFRGRENRRLTQVAWELSLQLSPHVTKEASEQIAPAVLFKKMPGSFPEDITELEAPVSEERARRRAKKRLQRKK